MGWGTELNLNWIIFSSFIPPLSHNTESPIYSILPCQDYSATTHQATRFSWAKYEEYFLHLAFFSKRRLSQSLLLIKHPTNKTHIETSRKLRKIWRAKYDNSFATGWWIIHLKHCLSICISRYMIEYLLPDSGLMISVQTHWWTISSIFSLNFVSVIYL